MGNDTERPPGKWEINSDNPHEILDENGDVICWTDNEPAENEALMAMSHADARFIVRACNTYDALVEACEDALTALNQLPSALWPVGLDGRPVCPYFGAISELLTTIALATEATDDTQAD